MKEDIIAANLSSLRADIQALPQKIAEELHRSSTELSASTQQFDEAKIEAPISKTIASALQSRLQDDEKYVDKVVTTFTELANMYNVVTANANKNAEIINRNIMQTEKRYAAMIGLMQAKKPRVMKQPPMPQKMKDLPRFICLTYPWYWIKRMYRSEHFRTFLVVCMACALAVSVFLTMFLAYDNAQLRGFCLSHIRTKI